MAYVSIAAKTRKNPPHWAVRQRDLIALMDRAAHPFSTVLVQTAP